MFSSQEPASVFVIEAIQRWPFIPVVACAFIAMIVVQRLSKPDPLAGIPIIGKGGPHRRRKFYVSGRAKELYFEGVKKASITMKAL